MKITCLQTSIQSPWQNGVAERWVGTCRRDLLDHVIALNERHLKRLLSDYLHYYHEDRTHLGLGKQTPSSRYCSLSHGRIMAQPFAPPLRTGRLSFRAFCTCFAGPAAFNSPAQVK
jgi:hypothetical protein